MKIQSKIIMSWVGNLLFVFTLMFTGCSCNQTHFYNIQWNGAFIIDSVTIGLIRWEYDYYSPDNAWADEEYENVRQDFYTYSLIDSQVTFKANLRKDCGMSLYEPGVHYHYPWVIFLSYGSKPENRLYNIETKENSLLFGSSGYPSPIGMSNSGRYVLYSGSIFDREENTFIHLTRFFKPLYFDESDSVFYGGMSTAYFDRFICSYKLGDPVDKYDTICARDSLYPFTRVSNNDEYVFFSDGQKMAHQALTELKNGCDNYQIMEGVPAEIFDFYEPTGMFVYTKNYDVYIGNYKQNIGAFKILEGSSNKKD